MRLISAPSLKSLACVATLTLTCLLFWELSISESENTWKHTFVSNIIEPASNYWKDSPSLFKIKKHQQLDLDLINASKFKLNSSSPNSISSSRSTEAASVSVDATKNDSKYLPVFSQTGMGKRYTTETTAIDGANESTKGAILMKIEKQTDSENITEVITCNCKTVRVRNSTLLEKESGPNKNETTEKYSIAQDKSKNISLYLDVFNQMGKLSTTIETLRKALSTVPESEQKASVWNLALEMEASIKKLLKKNEFAQIQKAKNEHRNSDRNRGPLINLAAIACGLGSIDEAMIMLKSAVIFSQDANLNVIAVTDYDSVIPFGQDLTQLKWTVNELGWDFTFELFQEYFPYKNRTGSEFRNLWVPCATQRLFFPSLLPHIDSLVYLDADTIVLSNLTDLWSHFGQHMKDGQLAALAANTEFPALGHYNLNAKVPYYGLGGLNGGVMLMNLTRMREFNMEERAVAAYTVYKENINLADQDIYNIIFKAYPEKLYLMDCSYNFNWVHCGDGPAEQCVHNLKPGPICFCNATMTSGLHIAHGNMGSFYADYPFLMQLNTKFTELNLLKDSVTAAIKDLMAKFDALNATACFSLTSEAMYGNALYYLENVH